MTAELPDRIWAQLVDAAGTPGHPMRHMALATADSSGPDVRMVVLRGARAHDRTLSFHTDARSPKCTVIARDPRVSLLFWDADAQLQLRGRAIARMLATGAAVDAEWDALSAGQRALYDAAHAPGAAREGPLTPPQGRAAFRVIACRLTAIDVLYLRDDGHQRWRINYAAGGAPTLMPVAP